MSAGEFEPAEPLAARIYNLTTHRETYRTKAPLVCTAQFRRRPPQLGGASVTSLTALPGPHTPLVQGPLRALLRRLGAVCFAPSGPHQRRQRLAFRPQPAQRAPAPGWPLGPLAGACESRHQATVVAIGRPGHHQPGLCCVVVLWTQAPSPQSAHQPGPCTPQLAPAGMALLPGLGMCTRPWWPPGEAWSPYRYPPALPPLQLRASDACGGPAPWAQRAPTQLRLRHHDRIGGHRACMRMPRSPGDGYLAASMEGGEPRPGPLLKTGRAAGATELNLFQSPLRCCICALAVLLRTLSLSISSADLSCLLRLFK